MPSAINVKNIVIHCTAGFGDVESILRYWRDVLGWKSPGYHLIIDRLGDIHDIAHFSKIVNGVRGYNNSIINISYIGGVKEDNYNIAEDNRTIEQKRSLHVGIQESILWLAESGKDVTKNMGIVGHRDFSKDLNNNGIIDTWERNKQCPSFDALKEYSYLYASPDRYMKLPYAI